MIFIRKILCIAVCLLNIGNSTSQQNASFLLHDWNNLLIEQMVKDGINPLLASRTFAYTNIAAYETSASLNKNIPALSGKLNGLTIISETNTDSVDLSLAAIQAFYKVAAARIYREYACDSLMKKHLQYFKNSGTSEEKITRSVNFGNEIASQINKWSKEDGYSKTKSMSYYIFKDEAGKWKPTPPEFRDALEPHWTTIRPLMINSPYSFSQTFNIPFSSEKKSEFYKLAYEVYDISKKLTPEQKEITEFWDDNPDMNTFKGHLPFPRRHISPPSHWISIVEQICKKEDFNFEKSAVIYCLTSVAMADAMICVWYDKYKYELIRPVTYIRNYIAPDWMPYIVTPPFPEFPSGHSSVSAAAAVILTKFAGKNYSFSDSTLVRFGIKARSFDSFNSAAEEISLSRVYGGIHYKISAEAGLKQGKKVGEEILLKIKNK